MDVFDRIAELRVVPVLAVDKLEHALPLADALLEGGLPIAEITFRTAAAAEVIRCLAQERPALLVGAGTITTPDQARRAKDCGARFGVAPGLNVDVLRAAADVGLPFAPGVMTPSEIERACADGLRVLKFFPAGAAGGVSMLKSVAAPYRHLGIRFIPTGGVTPENLAAYLALPEVVAVGGTWLAKQEDLAAARWNEIRQRCQQAVQLVT